MVDTHTHLQFKVFDKIRDQVVANSKKAGIEKIIAVGTDLESSEKAVEVAEKYPEVFASVGIHPHHVFGIMKKPSAVSHQLSDLEKLVKNPKVVAVGETGMDKHVYKITKYPNYLISNEFIELQKLFFEKQIKLAIKCKRSLIIHNREAVSETLEVLEKNWNKALEQKSVFHMCEPHPDLLDFAIKHKVFISFGEDITYDLEKQEFLKKVPLELLVLETDSPFISREPKDLRELLKFLTGLLKKDAKELEDITSNNSLSLFKL